MGEGFIDVLASSALLEGDRAGVEAGGVRLALVRVDGAVHALDEVCPHRGGLLSCGDVQGHHLYCPLHAWCFDVRDGRAFFPTGASVRRYPVREERGRILVDPGVGTG